MNPGNQQCCKVPIPAGNRSDALRDKSEFAFLVSLGRLFYKEGKAKWIS